MYVVVDKPPPTSECPSLGHLTTLETNAMSDTIDALNATPDANIMTVRELRHLGYAVIVWTPDELGTCAPKYVEDGSIEHGWQIIEQMQE
jgi:hypothetical protein